MSIVDTHKISDIIFHSKYTYVTKENICQSNASSHSLEHKITDGVSDCPDSFFSVWLSPVRLCVSLLFAPVTDAYVCRWTWPFSPVETAENPSVTLWESIGHHWYAFELHRRWSAIVVGFDWGEEYHRLDDVSADRIARVGDSRFRVIEQAQPVDED